MRTRRPNPPDQDRPDHPTSSMPTLAPSTYHLHWSIARQRKGNRGEVVSSIKCASPPSTSGMPLTMAGSRRRSALDAADSSPKRRRNNRHPNTAYLADEPVEHERLICREEVEPSLPLLHRHTAPSSPPQSSTVSLPLTSDNLKALDDHPPPVLSRVSVCGSASPEASRPIQHPKSTISFDFQSSSAPLPRPSSTTDTSPGAQSTRRVPSTANEAVRTYRSLGWPFTFGEQDIMDSASNVSIGRLEKDPQHKIERRSWGELKGDLEKRYDERKGRTSDEAKKAALQEELTATLNTLRIIEQYKHHVNLITEGDVGNRYIEVFQREMNYLNEKAITAPVSSDDQKLRNFRLPEVKHLEALRKKLPNDTTTKEAGLSQFVGELLAASGDCYLHGNEAFRAQAVEVWTPSDFYQLVPDSPLSNRFKLGPYGTKTDYVLQQPWFEDLADPYKPLKMKGHQVPMSPFANPRAEACAFAPVEIKCEEVPDKSRTQLSVYSQFASQHLRVLAPSSTFDDYPLQFGFRVVGSVWDVVCHLPRTLTEEDAKAKPVVSNPYTVKATVAPTLPRGSTKKSTVGGSKGDVTEGTAITMYECGRIGDASQMADLLAIVRIVATVMHFGGTIAYANYSELMLGYMNDPGNFPPDVVDQKALTGSEDATSAKTGT